MSGQSYVLVTKTEDEKEQEIFELPIEEDGTLLLSTLCNHFPNATGLSYRQVKRVENSNRRMLIKEEVHLENGKFYLSSDTRWSSHIFYCTFDKLVPCKQESNRSKTLLQTFSQQSERTVYMQKSQLTGKDEQDKSENTYSSHTRTEHQSRLEYKVLPGTLNQGEKYESIFVANIALDLALNADIKEFFISVNNAAFYPFDDVTLETEMMDGCQQKLALQLKHGERLLTIQSLTGKSGDFSIQKYMEGVSKMKKSSYQHQQLDNFKWILFTNRKCNFDENGVRFKSENGNFDIQMLRCEVENILKNCSKNGTCYKFQVEDASTEVGQFFENFFLYVGQLNVHQMENELSKRFQKEFGCDKITFVQYLNFINEWNHTKGTRKKLNKSWIRQLIAMHLLSPLIQPLARKSGEDKKVSVLRKCIEKFDITIFGRGDYKKLSQLWDVESELEKIDIKLVNELKDKFQLNSNDLIDTVSSKLLWLLEKCPLIIKYTENITKAIGLCKNKRFIVIYNDTLNDKTRNYFGDVSLFQNLSDLMEHSYSCYEELIKTFRCSLQRKPHITLETLLNKIEGFQSCITTDDLLLFLNDNLLVIGEEVDSLEIYIPRSFSRQIIEENFLEKSSEETTIVIDCFQETGTGNNHFKLKDIENVLNYANIYTEKTENRNKTIYVCKNRCTQKQLQELCNILELKNKKRNNLHLFRSFERKLEWIFSLAQITDLRNFLNDKEYFTNEEDLYKIESDSASNTLLFCGDAGSGKTTLMQKLKKNTFPSLWTVLLYPKDHSRHLKEIKGDIFKFEDYIINEARNKYSDFDLKIFEMLLKCGRVSYIWDGLDEVSENNINSVLEIIQALSEAGVKQFLAARNNLRSDLENRFSVFAKTIKEFDEEDQKHYIRKRLNCKGTELEELFRKISNYIYFYNYQEILSIPLQIYMFTELLLQDREKYNSILENMFSLTDLYEYFIDEKFNIYFKQKEKFDYADSDYLENMVKNIREKRMNQYESVALKAYFPQQVFEPNGADYKTFLTEVKSKDVFGIITSVSSENVVSFLHNSYGEYFAALYFSKNYKIQNLQFLFEERNRNIRFMFDLILAKGRPAHLATLCQNLHLLTSYNSDLLNTEVDRGGRNALHLACSWGEKYPLLKMIKSKKNRNKLTYHLYFPKRLLQKEVSEYENILTFLLKHCKPELSDRVYLFNALSYADETYNFLAVSLLLKTYVKPIEHLKCFQNIPLLLCYSAALDFSSIFNHVKAIPYIAISDGHENSLLSLAASNGSLFSCRKILSNSKKYRSDITDSLVKACRYGHVDVASLLIREGADIDVVDEDGKTPLITACERGLIYVANLLIMRGANIKIAAENGTTPLIAACKEGLVGIANLLIDRGADVNAVNKYGTSPLIAACETECIHIANSLIKAGADINLADKSGTTTLLAACREDLGDVVKWMIKADVDVNMVDKYGTSALLLACERGLVDLVKLLIRKGVDVNRVDRAGTSPLLAACENGHVNIANLLIRQGADVNVADRYGSTPLTAAYKKGLVGVANLLIKAGADSVPFDKN